MTLNNHIQQQLELLAPDGGTDISSVLYPGGEYRVELLVAMAPGDYSASAIARAVEDCEAHLVNLNLTSARTPSGDLVVALRTNAIDPAHLVRSLERYGYDVLAWSEPQQSPLNDEAERRAAELLRLLEI